MKSPAHLSAVVEGPIDEAVIRRLAARSSLGVSQVHVKHGKDRLDRKLSGYRQAARHSPWLVLRDLDHDSDCAPELVRQLLDSDAGELLLRVAVRAVEAWLLADAERLARHLSIRTGRIPDRPEELPDPKRTLVELAAGSSRRAIREAMVPRAGHTAKVGPGYTAELIAFASKPWRPGVAAERCDSLARCLRSLDSI